MTAAVAPLQAQAPVKAIPIWQATLRIMKELFVMSSVGHALAVFMAAFHGLANPFAAGTTNRRSSTGFLVWMVANCSIMGGLSSCCLVAFVLRGQSIKQNARVTDTHQEKPPVLSVWKSAVLAAKLTWRSFVVGTAVAVGVTLLLVEYDVPVATYNLHTVIACIAVASFYLRTTFNVVHYCRSTAVAQRRLVDVMPSPAVVAPSSSPESASIRVAPRTFRSPATPPSRSWRRTVRMAFAVAFPAVVTAVVTVEFITIARQIQLNSVRAVVQFTVMSTLLKTLLPVFAKLFIARQRIQNVHNTFFMIAAPVLHVEIQLRLALLRARTTLSIFASSAFVNLLEIGLRIVTVAVDLAFVRYERWRLVCGKKALLVTQAKMSQQHERDAMLQNRLDELDTEFEKWRRHHLRICAAENLAEMAAEYCGIGLVSIYAIVLHDNELVDMPTWTDTTGNGVLQSQLTAWATQVGFEIVTDLVATAMELRLGIPLLEVLVQDKDKFMRWASAVVVLHASGLCISSLVASQSTP